MGPVYGEGEHGCRRHGGPPTRSHKGDAAIDRVQAGEGEARASASRGFPKGGEGEHEPEGLARRCVADGPSRCRLGQQRHCQRGGQAGQGGEAPPPRGPGDREQRADRDDDLGAQPARS